MLMNKQKMKVMYSMTDKSFIYDGALQYHEYRPHKLIEMKANKKTADTAEYPACPQILLCDIQINT